MNRRLNRLRSIVEDILLEGLDTDVEEYAELCESLLRKLKSARTVEEVSDLLKELGFGEKHIDAYVAWSLEGGLDEEA